MSLIGIFKEWEEAFFYPKEYFPKASKEDLKHGLIHLLIGALPVILSLFLFSFLRGFEFVPIKLVDLITKVTTSLVFYFISWFIFIFLILVLMKIFGGDFKFNVFFNKLAVPSAALSFIVFSFQFFSLILFYIFYIVDRVVFIFIDALSLPFILYYLYLLTLGIKEAKISTEKAVAIVMIFILILGILPFIFNVTDTPLSLLQLMLYNLFIKIIYFIK